MATRNQKGTNRGTYEMTEEQLTSQVSLKKISKLNQEAVFEVRMPLPVIAEMLCEAVRAKIDQPQQNNHNGYSFLDCSFL
jgi:hypothetical protein